MNAESFDQLLVQLRILSKIEQGTKLCFSANGQLLLQPYSIMQRVSRWWYRDDRDKSERHVRDIVNRVGEFANLLMSSLHGVALFVERSPGVGGGGGQGGSAGLINAIRGATPTPLEWHQTQIDQLEQLARAIPGAAAGLRQLCKSYAGDDNTIARFEVCAAKLEQHADKIRMRMTGMGVTMMEAAVARPPPSRPVDIAHHHRPRGEPQQQHTSVESSPASPVGSPQPPVAPIHGFDQRHGERPGFF